MAELISAETEPEPLTADHDVTSFSCGNAALDTWFRTRAHRNQETGDSRTFVLTENGRPVGFYALTTASVARVSLHGSLRRNAPDPVPLLLLAQLAVATTHRGKGFGSKLLRDALLRAATTSRQVGFRAFATYPIDDEAVSFYEHFGFTLVPASQPRLMVMPLQRLFAAVEAARR